MFTNVNTRHHDRRCFLVPLLIDQFNDIIELKSKIVQNELEYQTQRAKKLYNRRYSYSSDDKLPGLERSATDSIITATELGDKFREQVPIQAEVTNVSIQPRSESLAKLPKKTKIIKLKRSEIRKSEFSQKFNRNSEEAIHNTINEQNETGDDLSSKNHQIVISDESSTPSMEIPKVEPKCYKTLIEIFSIQAQPVEHRIDELKLTIPTTNKCSTVTHKPDVILENNVSSINQVNNNEQPIDRNENILDRVINEQKNHHIIEQISNNQESTIDAYCNMQVDQNNDFIIKKNTKESPVKEIEPPLPPLKSMTRHNILLEKLSNSYRHQFEVKTVVFHQNGVKNINLERNNLLMTHCFCGKAFNFSEKYFRCFNCLTRCHTTCGQLLPKPCIRYVDPSMKPSKLISNYVYPRSKPSIPLLLINICREIEIKCQRDYLPPQHLQLQGHSSRSAFPSFELYYIQSEMLKPVKDQCKKLLQLTKYGYPPLDELNLDYLCGMVKYFLGEIVEPLFPKQVWKEYSITIEKKSDEELKRNLMETFHQLNTTNLHTLCFILTHLKHLNRCGFQDLDILADIFCPILMGDVECKRKLRLIKLMYQIEDNILVSYVES